ncbi:MAG: excinuclease ABC subunit UvrA [Flavobacteriales bacterium]|nr:excinuclease ABC subunit UvrA [Flavobacteriales bacterium]
MAKKNNTSFEDLDPQEYIIVKGARVHNLQNVDVAIPRDKLVVITGLSGSGKSSLAFETLYAEGQRQYVESLSSYARQFLGRLDKPDVDYIKGISPAIAIEQKVKTQNPRSTVGTSTEIYDYLKLLYARIGRTFSPVSGTEVKRHTVTDVVDAVLNLPPGTRAIFCAPVIIKAHRSLQQELIIYQQQGFSRLWVKGEIVRMEDAIAEAKAMDANSVELLVGRVTVRQEDDFAAELADMARTCFFEGQGTCKLYIFDEKGNISETVFSNRFEADGMQFEEPSIHLFSFNNPFGACKTCEGYGKILGIDEDLVIPDKSLSVYEGAVSCWKGDKLSEWQEQFIMHAKDYDFPIHKPYYDLSAAQKKLLWEGGREISGIYDFFRYVEENLYKIQYRVLLSRYRGRTTCPDCQGTRLRKDAGYVKVGGKSIMELVLMPVKDLALFFEQLTLSAHEQAVAQRILTEIKNRLGFLNNVGLGYLTLNRLSATLSGGESQRINLATSLGSSLVGSMYILDEPSIGLHPADTDRLVQVVKDLRDEGNTVIVVEHDEEFMRQADELIDMGPEAGIHGGRIVFQGNHQALLKTDESLTARYLTGKMKIEIPPCRRRWSRCIEVKGARENNLKNLNVKFPLGVLTAVTGVSGSGKTSLVKQILVPALTKLLGGYGEKSGQFDKIEGNWKDIASVELVDQNPIGKSSRSNPVTYLKVYDEIRNLYATLPSAKNLGLKPAHFSFNVPGGRCDICEGEGVVTIEMQFMADITLVCENCKGKRFKEEILDVRYRDKNISDILDLSVDEALDFFGNHPKRTVFDQKIAQKLKPLQDVGLGYIKLGQSSSTLSGGEAQRVKLAYFLSKGVGEGKTLFVFDEPTTGLHFHDIKKLLEAFQALIEKGHTVLVIEHNLDVIKCADWVIDLGPEGGDRGGEIIFEGIPEDLIKHPSSLTGKYLSSKFIYK